MVRPKRAKGASSRGRLERLQPSRKTKWVGRSTWEHHLGSGPVLEQRMQSGWSWIDALKMLTGRWSTNMEINECSKVLGDGGLIKI